jgi:hypothetical protein
MAVNTPLLAPTPAQGVLNARTPTGFAPTHTAALVALGFTAEAAGVALAVTGNDVQRAALLLLDQQPSDAETIGAAAAVWQLRSFRAGGVQRQSVVGHATNGDLYTSFTVEDEAFVEGFHGTTIGNAVNIIENGFRPSRGGMLGPGVYWSDNVAKTRPYVRDGSGTVLKLRIRNGRTKTIDRSNHPSQRTWHTEGYDSAWVPANTTPTPGWVQSGLSENCTYDPGRVVVTAVSADFGQTFLVVSEFKALPRVREAIAHQSHIAHQPYGPLGMPFPPVVAPAPQHRTWRECVQTICRVSVACAAIAVSVLFIVAAAQSKQESVEVGFFIAVGLLPAGLGISLGKCADKRLETVRRSWRRPCQHVLWALVSSAVVSSLVFVLTFSLLLTSTEDAEETELVRHPAAAAGRLAAAIALGFATIAGWVIAWSHYVGCSRVNCASNCTAFARHTTCSAPGTPLGLSRWCSRACTIVAVVAICVCYTIGVVWLLFREINEEVML